MVTTSVETAPAQTSAAIVGALVESNLVGTFDCDMTVSR
jgi:hypothetical protein